MKSLSIDSQIKNGVIELGRGNIISSIDISKHPGEYPIYSSSARNRGEFGRYSKFMFDEELITWSVDGGGKFFFRPRHKFSVTNVCGFMRVSTKEWNIRYVYFCLDFQHQRLSFDYQSKAHPSVIRHVYSLWDYTKPEQAKIAEILSTVDKAIEQTEALIAKHQRIKTGLMQDLLTRGIDEHGNLRSEDTHEFKDSPLGRIPVEWEWRELGSIIDIIDCKHYTPEYAKSGIPIVRPRNIKDSGFDLLNIDFVTEKDYTLLTNRHEPTDGDIVFSRNASFGIPVYVDKIGRFCIGQDVVVMKRKTVNTLYIYYALKSNGVTKQIANVSGGSTFGRIDLGAIRELKISFPVEGGEQFALANRLSLSDRTIRNTQRELSKLRSLKTALMQDLLNGKVRVTPLLNKPVKASA